MIQKMKNMLANNVVLTIFLVVILGVTGCVVWKYTLHWAVGSVETINSVRKNDTDHLETMDEVAGDGYVEYTDAGTLYHSPSGVDAGPFRYIYTDEFSWETSARYIGDNGKYGYLNKDGSLLTEPIFIEAAKFQDGTAKVCQEDGKIYYIAKNAERITKDYQDGSSAFEMQGEFCRVQTENGKWGIINRKDEMILSEADSIEELPLVTCFGSAVIDGKAVLFELNPFDGDEEIRIIARYDSFVKISHVYSGVFAFVWTEDGLMGVVDYKGDIIVPAEYQSIKFEYLGEDSNIDDLVFIAQDMDGKNHVMKVYGGVCT